MILQILAANWRRLDIDAAILSIDEYTALLQQIKNKVENKLRSGIKENIVLIDFRNFYLPMILRDTIQKY
jgi:hypothetical protein